MIGLKARRNGHDFFQAQAKQSSAGQENERESDLRDDEPVTQILGSAADPATAGFRLESIRQITSEIEPGDRRRDYNSKNDRAHEPDRREPAVKRDLRAER